MKTPVNYLIIISLLAIITFSGCKKGGSPVPEPVVPDTTKPTINITKPTAGQSLTVGSLLAFQATFSDNVQLKSYEIVISKVIAGGLTLKSVPTPVDWSYTKSATSFGTGAKQQEITLGDITIPMDISGKPVSTGKYNFKVTCVDSSNNSTDTTVQFNII